MLVCGGLRQPQGREQQSCEQGGVRQAKQGQHCLDIGQPLLCRERQCGILHAVQFNGSRRLPDWCMDLRNYLWGFMTVGGFGGMEGSLGLVAQSAII